MELRQIYYFLEASKLCNLSKAANNLFITQSTLSDQIHKLETELQTNLFYRKGRKVILSAEGQLFREQCEKIVKCVSETVESMNQSRTGIKGELRIGVLPTISLSWLPPFLSSFSKRYPDVHCSIKELSSLATENDLKDYEIDIGISALPPKDTFLNCTPLYTEELVLIASKQQMNELPRKQKLVLADIQEKPFIIYEKGYHLREIILNAFFQSGCHPKIILESGRTETIKRFVANSYGVALVPESCIHYLPSQEITYYHLQTPLTRTVGLLTRPNEAESGVLKTFSSELRKLDPRRFTKPDS